MSNPILRIVDKHIEIEMPGKTYKVLEVYGSATNWLWLATEQKGKAPKRTFYGLVYGLEREWGSFSEAELLSIPVISKMTSEDIAILPWSFPMADWEE